MSLRELLKLGGFNDPGTIDSNWNCPTIRRRNKRARTDDSPKSTRCWVEGDRVLARCHGSLQHFPGIIRGLVQKADQPVGYKVLFDDGTTDGCVNIQSIKRENVDSGVEGESDASTGSAENNRKKWKNSPRPNPVKDAGHTREGRCSPCRLYGKKRWLDMELKATQAQTNKENAKLDSSNTQQGKLNIDNANAAITTEAKPTAHSQPLQQTGDRRQDISYILSL